MRKAQEIKFRKGYDDDKPLRKAQVRRVRRNSRAVIRQQLADMRYINELYPVGDEYTYQTDFDEEFLWD